MQSRRIGSRPLSTCRPECGRTRGWLQTTVRDVPAIDRFDSEQFRPDPRTCPLLCGRLSVRQTTARGGRLLVYEGGRRTGGTEEVPMFDIRRREFITLIGGAAVARMNSRKWVTCVHGTGAGRRSKATCLRGGRGCACIGRSDQSRGFPRSPSGCATALYAPSTHSPSTGS